MPVIGRTGSNPVIPSSVDTTPEAADSIAATTPSEISQPQGWAAKDTTNTPRVTTEQPSRLEKLEDKAKGKVLELAINQVADEHSLGQGFSFGAVQGNVKLSEKVALKNSDTYKNLVAPDRRRNDFAQGHGDSVWVQSRALAGVSASFPLGAGSAVGFNGSMEVSTIMAHAVDGAGDAATAVKDQGKSLALPIDADGLDSLKPAPGSEWMFRGQAGANLGIGAGKSVTVGNSEASLTANVGVSVGASAQAVYSKNVKVLEGGKVYVQVARQDTEAASIGVSASVRADINAKEPVSVAIGPGSGGALAGKAVDQLGNQVEKRTAVGLSGNAGVAAGQKLMGAAVLDLNTPQGRAAYDFILKSGPAAAADYIQSQGLGARYTETSTNRTSGLNLQFGSDSLLATSTARGTTNGVLEEPGSKTLLTEATYGRSVGGFLPRLAMGEERTVAVRAGTVNGNDGTPKEAVAVGLAVKDTQLTSTEAAQVTRFAEAMGAPLSGLPAAPADGKYGKAVVTMEVALTDDNISRLRQWNEGDIKLAFANAHREIDGATAPPPWYSNPAEFADYARRYRNTSNPHNGMENRQSAVSAYHRQYGRDLATDLESSQAIDDISKQVTGARGKPVAEWGKALEALGKQPSGDVRAAILALRRLSGAGLVKLSVEAGGTTATAKPETTAPRTLGEIVGPVLAPPA